MVQNAAAGQEAPRKGLAIASLVLGILSLLTLGCLGIGALAGVVLGIFALVKASRDPYEYGGKGLAIGGIVTSGLSLLLLPVVGIVAAIAIPSLLRARVSANEAQTIGDIRTMISAQVAYSSVNSGFYDSPDCLVSPTACIEGYPAEAPNFLDGAFVADGTRGGYVRRFYAGPAPSSYQAEGASPSSLTSFAFVAVPETPGQTGVRGFCGDSTGLICVTLDGSEPGGPGGTCEPGCQPLN